MPDEHGMWRDRPERWTTLEHDYWLMAAHDTLKLGQRPEEFAWRFLLEFAHRRGYKVAIQRRLSPTDAELIASETATRFMERLLDCRINF